MPRNWRGVATCPSNSHAISTIMNGLPAVSSEPFTAVV